MIEFECQNCGKKKEENVLPGKHAILGTLRSIQYRSECCDNPSYFDSRGFKQGMTGKSLRDIAVRA